jgi:hypothetical protein
MFESVGLVCVRLSGRISGPSRDREFDLEQEDQRPGTGRDRLHLVLAVLAHEMIVAVSAPWWSVLRIPTHGRLMPCGN